MSGTRAVAAWRAVVVAGGIFVSLTVATQVSIAGQLPPQQLTGTVFVARRGWHIDLGFAVDELAPPLHAMADVFPGARYLFFGFGDRRYLTATRRGAPVLLRALWPGSGLLLVTALRAAPAAAFGAAHVVHLTASREGSLHVQAFVWQSMTTTQQTALATGDRSNPTAADRGAEATGIPGPYEGSRFFESRQTYSAAYTCNTWAAVALGITGAPVQNHGVVFAGQLWDQLRFAADRAGGAATNAIPPPTAR
jgi:hypothetical protein